MVGFQNQLSHNLAAEIFSPSQVNVVISSPAPRGDTVLSVQPATSGSPFWTDDFFLHSNFHNN